MDDLTFSMDSNFLHRGGVKKLEEIIWQSALFILKISYSPWNPNQSPELVLYTLRMAMAPVSSNSCATLMNRPLNEETCPGCDLLSPHWRWDKTINSIPNSSFSTGHIKGLKILLRNTTQDEMQIFSNFFLTLNWLFFSYVFVKENALEVLNWKAEKTCKKRNRPLEDPAASVVPPFLKTHLPTHVLPGNWGRRQTHWPALLNQWQMYKRETLLELC